MHRRLIPPNVFRKKRRLRTVPFSRSRQTWTTEMSWPETICASICRTSRAVGEVMIGHLGALGGSRTASKQPAGCRLNHLLTLAPPVWAGASRINRGHGWFSPQWLRSSVVPRSHGLRYRNAAACKLPAREKRAGLRSQERALGNLDPRFSENSSSTSPRQRGWVRPRSPGRTPGRQPPSTPHQEELLPRLPVPPESGRR